MEENELSRPAAPIRKLKRHFFLAVIGIALLLALLGQMLGEILLGVITKPIPDISGGVAFLFMHYLSFIGTDVLVLIYCAVCEKAVFRSFFPKSRGGGRGNTFRNFALGLLFGFLMNGICILLAWLHGDIQLYAGRFEVLYLICALVCVCVQSGAEELVTRGYIMGALRERYPVWAAIAGNVLFFAVLHLANPGITVLSFLNIVFIGVALSLVMVYFDSLWMCIAIHTAWNFTQNFLFGLPNSGIVSESSFLHLDAAADSLFYNVAFGVEGTLTAVIVIGLFAVGVALYARKKNPAGAQLR